MSWKKVKLAELVENFSIRAKDVGGSDNLEFFGVSNEFGIIKTKYAAEEKAEDYKIIEKKCFAYNPYRVNVGSIGLVSEDTKGLISPAYVVFKPKPNTIIPELLLKFLKSSEGLRQIKFYARGTVRQALRFEDLCNIELSIPGYKEQGILYKKLNISQEKSDILNSELIRQLDLVKKLRQQLLQDAVQGKLVEQVGGVEPACELLKKIKAEKAQLIKAGKIRQGKIQEAECQDEILFEIPDNWIWCKLDDICINITDGTHQTPTYTTSGRIFLSAQNIKPFRFMPEEHKFVSEEAYQEYINNKKAEKGDILVARVGAGIGEAAVIDQEIDFGFYVSLGLIQPFKQYINSDYLALVINSPYGVKYSKGNISSKGGSAGNFNLGRIRSFLIPLPPLSEQHRIVQKLEQLMQVCADLEQSIQASQTQNEQLLQQVLREALRKDGPAIPKSLK